VGVLVVDDHAENRAALKAILPPSEYRIVEASSGPEALRRLLDEDFAALLIDVLMPGMDGLELAHAIRARPRSAVSPILFLTAQTPDLDLIRRGYEAGAVDYLVKPLVPEVVRAKAAVFAELFRQRRRIEEQGRLLVEAERKESDLRLVELRLASERRYRSLAEAIPQIVWTAHPDGVVDYVNQRWFEYTGISTGVIEGSWDVALHPDDLSRSRQAWREALRSGERVQMECRLRQGGTGLYRWHLCRAVPERSASGQIVSWLGTFTDIEDQKRAQLVLAEFKGMLDAVLDAVFIFDPQDWRFLYLNHGAVMLLGYSEEELLRMRPLDFLAEHDVSGFREVLAPLLEGARTATTLETQVRRWDGRIVPVEVSLQFIPIDGGRIVSIARDITERRHAQLERELLYREATDAVRARDEFLSIASHELRTPLSTLQLQVQSFLRVLRRDSATVPGPEQTRGKLEIVARQIERLSRLVGELMDVSRINAGRLQLQFEETDLVAVAHETAGRLQEEAARKQTTIEVSAEGELVGTWDRMRLEQIVTNLLTNAMKFGEGKPIELTVADVGPSARLTVRDHGIGIAPEDAERIFRRYEQAVTARVYGGLGLGLYIVRQIVEAHGGTIRVESQPGAGSSFIVELPRTRPEKEEPRLSPEREAGESGTPEEAQRSDT
jgi:PAS domain S-box-containing protein